MDLLQPHITISVTSQFEPSISNLSKQEFFFSYCINIKNKNKFPIQILYRYWDILDFALGSRKIEGAGIVGEQPIISPYKEHTYSSFCFLKYPVGRMKGKYDIINTITQLKYKVSIPQFLLFTPYMLN